MAVEGEEYTDLLLELLSDVGTAINAPENGAPGASGTAIAANIGDGGAAAHLGALTVEEDAGPHDPPQQQEEPAEPVPQAGVQQPADAHVVNGATGPLFLPLYKGGAATVPPAADAFVAPSTLPQLPPPQQQGESQPATDRSSGQAEAKESQQVAGQRRKRLTSTQVMADLTAQVARQVALARQLSMNNIWLAERMRIMELVIAVRAGQVVRLQEIRKGLDFNPFMGFRATVQEMKEASPSKLADKVLELTGSMAMRLAAVQPLLQTNPHMLALSQPAGPIPPVHMAADPRRPIVPPPLAPLVDTTYAHMVPELQQLVVEVQRMQMGYSFLFLMLPHMLRVGNLNLQTLQDSATPWDSLLESMSQQATSTAGLAWQLPTLAPEVQWVKLAESLRLSDLQRLRAATLWDIINTARRSVLQQRAHLAQALGQVLAQSHGESSASPAAAPAVAAPSATPPSADHSASAAQAGSPAPASSAPQPTLTGGSSSGRPGATVGGGHQHQSSSEALSGGAPLARSQSSSSHGRLEGQVRARMAQGPAALQQEAALLEKLHCNTIKERCLILIAAETMFRFIFSPVQNAVALVSAYPFVLDQLAVLHAAATEFQPHVLERLASTMESAASGAVLPSPPAAHPATSNSASRKGSGAGGAAL